MGIPDIYITSVETIQLFHPTTGAYLCTLDELQDATFGQTQETADVTGKNGRLLGRMKRNKAASISGTNGLVSAGLLEIQTGNDFANKATKVRWNDYLKVASGAATTSYKAVGTAGAEIIALYIKNADGTLGTKLTQDSTAASGKFAYNPSTKALSFYSDVTDGTEIFVVYDRNITADVLENSSSTVSKKAKVYIDALAEDECANVYHVQIYFPLADFNGEFSLSLGGDQTVHGFEAQSVSGGCGASGNLWTYTIFGVNTPDTPVS